MSANIFLRKKPRCNTGAGRPCRHPCRNPRRNPRLNLGVGRPRPPCQMKSCAMGRLASRPDRPRVKKKPQVGGGRTLLGSMVLASTMQNGSAGQPGTWGRSRFGPLTPPDSNGVPRNFPTFLEKEKEPMKFPKFTILHGYYIMLLWIRVFCTCTMPWHSSIESAHSWSCKLVHRSIGEQKLANHPIFEALQN